MALPAKAGELVLLHNPRCSKSRAARELLEERGVVYAERRYLEAPLTRDELDELHSRLRRAPRDWVRAGEGAFAELGLTKQAPDAELLDAIAREPILLERPILVRHDRAIVGRPPENVLELLPD